MKVLVIIFVLIVAFWLAYNKALFSSRVEINFPEKENNETQNQLSIYMKNDAYTLQYKSIKKTNKDLSLLLRSQEFKFVKQNQGVSLIPTTETKYEQVSNALILLKAEGWVNIELITENSK